MGILREAVLASTPTGRDRAPNISCSQLFPCPYRLYLAHTGNDWEEPEPVNLLNMKDGFDQEEQAVRRLAGAGIRVRSRGKGEREVVIGKSSIPGSIDGLIDLEGNTYLWEHKAMSSNRFWEFCNKGLSLMVNYYCQIQAYMSGKKVTKAILQAKNKDNNDIEDKTFEFEKEFLDPILEWADAIRLDKWVPEPRECKWCSLCSIKCFGEIIDFSHILEASVPEMVEEWARGKQLQAVGAMLEDEARTFFIGKKDTDGTVLVPGLIGDKEVLLIEGIKTPNIEIEGIKVSRIPTHRFELSKQKLIEHYGVEALSKVGTEKELVIYRVEEWPRRRK